MSEIRAPSNARSQPQGDSAGPEPIHRERETSSLNSAQNKSARGMIFSSNTNPIPEKTENIPTPNTIENKPIDVKEGRNSLKKTKEDAIATLYVSTAELLKPKAEAIPGNSQNKAIPWDSQDPTYRAANKIANDFFDRLENTNDLDNTNDIEIKEIKKRSLAQIKLLNECKTLEKEGEWNSNTGDIYIMLLSIYLEKNINIHKCNAGQFEEIRLPFGREDTEKIDLLLKDNHFTLLEKDEKSIAEDNNSEVPKGYTMVEVEKDGNCLFRCLQIAMNRNKDDHMELRTKLVEDIRTKIKKYDPALGFLS